ncbi:MAG TPA: sulfatase, partial [Planctomycetota bacterium]|nr:sulfatase [Planctomycetota bacterium]
MRAALQRGGVLTLALCAAACGAREVSQPPLVALVALDSLAAARCGAWGHARATTPHLDALAAEGVRFADASSQSSWTLPSIASLFTGLEQERHGLRHLDGRLSAHLPLLAERFAAAGWSTRAVVQTPVLRSSTGLGRGFDDYRVLGLGNADAREALERALAAVAACDTTPLFLYLHLAPPHMPYQPPPPFAGRFVEDGVGESAVDGSIAACRAVHELGLGPEHPDMLRLAAHYDEHVAFADGLLGEFVAGLPPGREALIVVLSDHGEAFGQHGAQGHNTQVHREMLHVPLVVAARPRGRLAARVVEAPVSLLDLAPTLLERFGLSPLGDDAPGRSLAPWLDGTEPTQEPRTLRFSSRYRRRADDLQLGMRVGDLSLVLADGGARAALYDLANDPGETRDLC